MHLRITYQRCKLWKNWSTLAIKAILLSFRKKYFLTIMILFDKLIHVHKSTNLFKKMKHFGYHLYIYCIKCWMLIYLDWKSHICEITWIISEKQKPAPLTRTCPPGQPLDRSWTPGQPLDISKFRRLLSCCMLRFRK